MDLEDKCHPKKQRLRRLKLKAYNKPQDRITTDDRKATKNIVRITQDKKETSINDMKVRGQNKEEDKNRIKKTEERTNMHKDILDKTKEITRNLMGCPYCEKKIF